MMNDTIQHRSCRKSANLSGMATACVLPLGLLLSACSLAPTQPASAPAADARWQAAGNWLSAQKPTELQPVWWTTWNDKVLNQLENSASQTNQDLLAADARIEQARAAARAAHATLFPSLGIGASHSVNQASSHKPFLPPGLNTNYQDNVLALDASWEPDVWGQLSNTALAADQRTQAAIDDKAALMLSLQAEVASDYFLLRATDTDIDELQQLVSNRLEYLQLTQQMLSTGIATITDIDQATAAYDNAKSNLANRMLARDQLQHALALLCGEPATHFQVAVSNTGLPAPLIPSLQLPSRLLMRRPDIASAAAAMQAANAQIGVARAAFFPAINLNAVAGYESTAYRNWLSAPTQLWSFGPSVAMTLFDAGRLNALDDQAHAAWRESVANWRGSILNAWKEVEDNLSAVHRLNTEQQANDDARERLDEQLTHANMALQTGILAQPDWLNTQSQQITAHITAEDTEVQALIASITLIKSLGGGWQPTS